MIDENFLDGNHLGRVEHLATKWWEQLTHYQEQKHTKTVLEYYLYFVELE